MIPFLIALKNSWKGVTDIILFIDQSQTIIRDYDITLSVICSQATLRPWLNHKRAKFIAAQGSVWRANIARRQGVKGLLVFLPPTVLLFQEARRRGWELHVKIFWISHGRGISRGKFKIPVSVRHPWIRSVDRIHTDNNICRGKQACASVNERTRNDYSVH